MYKEAIIVAVLSVSIKLDAVPPEACFANFRWENCGGPPERVIYYWKPGSRCEVGIWRGCLPNMNMFKDEYECISTCIFTARAQAQDYHALFTDEDIELTTGFNIETTTDIEVTTGEVGTNNTDVEGNVTSQVSQASTSADVVNTTSADVNSTST